MSLFITEEANAIVNIALTIEALCPTLLSILIMLRPP